MKKIVVIFCFTLLSKGTFAQRVKTVLPNSKGNTIVKSKMVWSEEFNLNNLDTIAWKVNTGEHGSEEQYYHNSKKNIFIENGILKLTAHKEKYERFNYSSGQIISKKEFSFGYYEVRAKVPSGKGLWPAFWFYKGSGTYYQEIDVFEFGGSNTSRYWVNNFWKAATGDLSDNAMIIPKLNGWWFFNKKLDLSDDFFTYGVNWTPNKIEYYFNGQLVHVKTTHVPQLPMPVFLNLAVGGFYDGPPNAQTVFPCSFEIDYFRAYENLK